MLFSPILKLFEGSGSKHAQKGGSSLSSALERSPERPDHLISPVTITMSSLPAKIRLENVVLMGFRPRDFPMSIHPFFCLFLGLYKAVDPRD
jgi:hypothetical protein